MTDHSNQASTGYTLQSRVVRCPGCGGNSVYGPANAYRPFCSARCKGVDLGAWASEQFRVPEPGGIDDLAGDLAGNLPQAPG